MSWPIVGIVGVVLLFIFSYGVVPSPPSKPIQLSSFLDLNDTPNTYSGQAGKVPTVNGTENGLIFLDVNGGGGLGDTNQVKVSANDTTPDYLFSKLQAGSNITLTIQNAGGDENILISSTATGGSGTGRTYTSGTPATLQVNNDTNTISQNFDGNFWRMFALGEPFIDGNALGVINSLDLNNSLSYAKTDTNCSFNLNCTITGTIDTNNNADFNGSIIRFRRNVLAPDINIATTANRVDVINVKQVNCANNTRSCLDANPNQKIFSVASGTAFQTFVNPQRYVGIGTLSGGVDLYPHRFYTSGGGDASFITMARTTDPTGQEQFAGRLYLKQLTTSEGQDVNAWQQQQTNGGSFLQLGAIQYGDFRVVGDTNLSNLTIERIGNDVNITNQYSDGNISLNVRNVNGDLNNGLTIFKGGRLSAPNLKTINAGGKLPLSWDSNHEIVVDVSSANQKINIRDLNVVVDTSRLSFLKPRAWEDAIWGGQGSGYLAEEVEPFYPELVVRDNTGKIMGVDYQTLSIYFSAELLVQKQRADKLQTKLDLFVNTYCLTHIQEPACIAVNQTGLP